jgi:hypothetical protein
MTTRQCAQLLSAALVERKKSHLRESDVATMLRRSLGIDHILCGPLTDGEAAEFRRKVHVACGAPGDWGYDTPLGKALQQLYAAQD